MNVCPLCGLTGLSILLRVALHVQDTAPEKFTVTDALDKGMRAGIGRFYGRILERRGGLTLGSGTNLWKLEGEEDTLARAFCPNPNNGPITIFHTLTRTAMHGIKTAPALDKL